MNQPWPDEPEAFMAAYLDAWNQGDTERVLDAYHPEAPILQAGAIQASDAESRSAYLGGWIDMTRDELARGTRWSCPSLDVVALGRDAALLTARWVFTRADGSIAEDYPDSYVLAHIGGRWGFLADVIHSTEVRRSP